MDQISFKKNPDGSITASISGRDYRFVYLNTKETFSPFTSLTYERGDDYLAIESSHGHNKGEYIVGVEIMANRFAYLHSWDTPCLEKYSQTVKAGSSKEAETIFLKRNFEGLEKLIRLFRKEQKQ